MTHPQQQAPQPGQYYFLPGYTQFTEQEDNNTGLVQVLSQANSVALQGAQQFTQTDVVFWWEMELTITSNVTPGTSTVTTSPYFPLGFIGESRLRIQNMYDSWHVINGIDAYVFQLIRPMRGLTDSRNNLGSNPAGGPNQSGQPGQITSSFAQANLDAQTNDTSATSSLVFTLEIPVSVAFDLYFDLGKDGSIVSEGHRARVSPQYMAGSARVIAPKLNYNPGSAATLDGAPFNIGAGSGTFSGQISHLFKRVGIYGENNAATMPIVYPWQYMRDVIPFGAGGRSKLDIIVPTYGQILSLFIRGFDPAANGGLGAPININVITRCDIKYGSQLYRFQDTPRAAQRRFIKQHGTLLPQGVLAWDLAVDEFGRVTNAMAINTLTTASMLVHLEFSAPLSATAYFNLGVEALTYVE